MEQPSYNVLPDDTQVPAQPQNEVVTFGTQGGMPTGYDPKQRHKNDGIIPQFYIQTALNKFKSNQEGRPIYDEIEFIRIIIAGDRNNQPERKVREEDKQRWPVEYAAFKRGEKMAESGTPLEQWPACSRAMAASMKHYNVFTVEQLAGLSDTGLQSIGMGAREMQKQAIAYLEYAKDSALPAKMVAENERLQSTVAALQKQVEDLGRATADYANVRSELEAAKAQLAAGATAQDDNSGELIQLKIRLGEVERQNYELSQKLEAANKIGKSSKKTE